MTVDDHEHRFRRAGLPMLVEGRRSRWELLRALPAIVGFTARRLGRQLRHAVGLIARSLPVLLLFAIVLFINTEMWQVFATMSPGRMVGVGALLIGAGSLFVAIRLPGEVTALEREVHSGHALTKAQRYNVALVLFVSQALQVLVVSAAVTAFFLALGVLAVPGDVVESWIGTRGTRLEVLGLVLSSELLRVSLAIGALSGLYYTAAVLTDESYREELLSDVTEGMRETFVLHAKYLADRSP